MDKKLLQQNIQELDQELKNAGFPEDWRRETLKALENRNSAELVTPYKAIVGATEVTGEVRFYLMAAEKYHLSSFTVGLGPTSTAPIRENLFNRSAGPILSLPEAVNMMAGRSIYREPEFDVFGRGYWAALDKKETFKGFHMITYLRNGFQVEKAIEASPLGRFLAVNESAQLAKALRRGERVELTLDGLKRNLFVETDPIQKRLKFSDGRKKEIVLPEKEQAMGRSLGKRR
jgi:hypothetical protein